GVTLLWPRCRILFSYESAVASRYRLSIMRMSSKMKLWLYPVLKQLRLPVWHVGPLGCAFIKTVSWSQSICVLTTSRKFPLSSPFVHSLFLLLEQNVTRPSARVFRQASSFI